MSCNAEGRSDSAVVSASRAARSFARVCGSLLSFRFRSRSWRSFHGHESSRMAAGNRWCAGCSVNRSRSAGSSSCQPISASAATAPRREGVRDRHTVRRTPATPGPSSASLRTARCCTRSCRLPTSATSAGTRLHCVAGTACVVSSQPFASIASEVQKQQVTATRQAEGGREPVTQSVERSPGHDGHQPVEHQLVGAIALTSSTQPGQASTAESSARTSNTT
jgi:hypothetical protein